MKNSDRMMKMKTFLY